MPNPKNEVRRSSYVIFFPLLFVMLIFEIMHLPASIAAYRPDFMATLVLFFMSKDPKRINVGIAWISGLILDLIAGAPFGINALTVALQVFIVGTQFRHFADFMVWQQMIIIGIVNLVSHIGVYWLGHLIGQSSYTTHFSLQALITLLIWPIMLGIYRFLWYFFRVSSVSSKPEQEL